LVYFSVFWRKTFTPRVLLLASSSHGNEGKWKEKERERLSSGFLFFGDANPIRWTYCHYTSQPNYIPKASPSHGDEGTSVNLEGSKHPVHNRGDVHRYQL
jgi:hypothetical protein